VMRVGHIPVTADASVSIASSGSYLHELLRMAKEALTIPT
jgi:hypothetical protein